MTTDTEETEESWEDLGDDELDAFVSDDEDVETKELPGRYGCKHVSKY